MTLPTNLASQQNGGHESRTEDNRGHSHRDHALRARSPTGDRVTTEQFKAYFDAVENRHNPLRAAVRDTIGSRLARGKSSSSSSVIHSKSPGRPLLVFAGVAEARKDIVRSRGGWGWGAETSVCRGC